MSGKDGCNGRKLSGPCEPEYQTARSILAFRVVFYRFTDLLDIDSAENTLVDRMPGELKLTLRDLVANLMDSRHAGIISSWPSSMRPRTVRRSRAQRSSCGAPRYFAACLASALLGAVFCCCHHVRQAARKGRGDPEADPWSVRIIGRADTGSSQ